MTKTVLSVRDLKKSFRKGLAQKQVDVLNGISFDIPQACITGFLGANGAGKTTTIKCLLNLAFADSGSIRFFGDSELNGDVKSKIGFLPERPYFYEYLTGREFLRFYGDLCAGLTKNDLKKRIDELLKRVGLEHASERPLRSYSKGMLQRIGIAQALINSPEFIILDEPMTGLDPDGRFEVREIIRETAKAGTSVFFSSHLLPDAEKICERLVILKKGHVVFQGQTEELLNRVEKGFHLVTSQNGRISTETASSAEQLQKTIDQRRASGALVLEVHPNRLTLEEAFVQVAMGNQS